MVFNKIIELKEIIVNQANRIEKMIINCIAGINNKDIDALNKIINKQEKKVNKKEIKIDEIVTNILALYHPEAKDLRYVLMMARMNYDLERMGDHCVNIAEALMYLIDKPEIKPLIDIPRMADMTLSMLRDGTNAFINEDASAAFSICKRDAEVDHLSEQIFRELLTYMISDPKTIEAAIYLIKIANDFERIADLTTNLSEETIYIVEGKVIKHHKYKKYEDQNLEVMNSIIGDNNENSDEKQKLEDDADSAND